MGGEFDDSDYEDEYMGAGNSSLQEIKRIEEEKPKVPGLGGLGKVPPLGMNKLNLDGMRKGEDNEQEKEKVEKKVPMGFNLDISKAKREENKQEGEQMEG